MFDKDFQRALSVSKPIEPGIRRITGPTVADEARMPFGDAKASGHRRFGRLPVIDAVTELRRITIEGPHDMTRFDPGDQRHDWRIGRPLV